MKTFIKPIIAAIFALTTTLLFVQCDTEESRKEKAEGLIKQDLFETLPDYKSYELVSIEMDTIKESWVSIPGIIELAKEYQLAFADECNAKIKYNELLNQKERLKNRAFNRYMASDLFGLAKIGKEKKQLDNQIANADSQWAEAAEKAESLYGQLTDKIASNKSEDFVGWNVIHKFRANNDDGVSQLYCYHYYISPDMKRIILKWADDDEEIPQLFNLMESVLDVIKNSGTSSAQESVNDKNEELKDVAAIAVYDDGEKIHFKSDKTIAEIPGASWNKVKNALVYYTGEGTLYMSIIDGYEYEGEYRQDGKCWKEEWNASDECLDDVGYTPTKDNGKKLKSFKWVE
ncbi:MAG: hypothetical protein Q4F93_02635 [bacterium]|nr:hypothetical protein [bacterium]